MKTKLGISVGLMGAALYLGSYYGGYVVMALMVGYVLLCEENQWLKTAAVKATLIVVAFSLLNTVIGLLPELLNLIDSLFRVFRGNLYVPFIENASNLFYNVLNLLKKVLMIGLAVLALINGDQKSDPLDKLVQKFM